MRSKLLCFSFLQRETSCLKDDQGGRGHGDMRVTVLAHTSTVCSGAKIGNSKNHSPETQQKALSPSQPAKQDAPKTQTTCSHDLPLIRETLNVTNIYKEPKDIIMASWRTGTSKQYQVGRNSVNLRECIIWLGVFITA